MKITFLELRRDPKKLLDALERNEQITLSRRGNIVAQVIPTPHQSKEVKVTQNPAFGMWAEDKETENPTQNVRNIRRSRFHDL
ncbi:MAG: hypothetical protein ACFCU1_07835 [Sumerlaeia bacterium]